MLILPVIVIRSYLYPVCLVSRVLKSKYFKEHLSVVASKYRSLHYVQCWNVVPTKKTWFMALMEKELWHQWNISSKFIAHMERACTINRCTIKDTISIKISFIHYRNYITWTRVKLPSLFQEFHMVNIFGSFLLFTTIVYW